MRDTGILGHLVDGDTVESPLGEEPEGGLLEPLAGDGCLADGKMLVTNNSKRQVRSPDSEN